MDFPLNLPGLKPSASGRHAAGADVDPAQPRRGGRYYHQQWKRDITVIGVLSITSGKCQQEFRTTRRSSTALKVWDFGNADELKEEKFEISHTLRLSDLH